MNMYILARFSEAREMSMNTGNKKNIFWNNCKSHFCDSYIQANLMENACCSHLAHFPCINRLKSFCVCNFVDRTNIEEKRSEQQNLNHRNDSIANDTSLDNTLGLLSRETCIYIYTAVTVGTVLITLVRSLSFVTACMRASVRLHDLMFRSISRATMYFFNTNPSGKYW
jgi:hypothetical protein